MKKILMAVASTVLACGIGVAAVGCGGADGDITVVNRTAGSGTRDAFLEIIGITDEELTPDAAEAQETQNVITTVSGNEKAIGYISLGSLNDTVKAVNVGGHAPTAEAISGGDYAIARPFNVMYDERFIPTILAFIFEVRKARRSWKTTDTSKWKRTGKRLQARSPRAAASASAVPRRWPRS